MVELIKTTQDLHISRNQQKGQIGFVPTMGNLHAGHISLLEEALKHNDIVYFSIFVNPKQFGANEDFGSYPRTLDYDLSQIQECSKGFPEKKVIVFAPEKPTEVFPLQDTQTISVYGLNRILEGKFRPDHFDGVTTVVLRLFQLVRPTKAYFGLKDYQQFIIIRQMTKDLQLPIEVIGMPIIRETSNLAMSSRNQYLSDEQKEAALILFTSLKKIANLIENKKANLPVAKREIDVLLLDPNWNYLEIRDSETLSDDLTNSPKLALLGVYQLGNTRLLDNIQLDIE